MSVIAELIIKMDFDFDFDLPFFFCDTDGAYLEDDIHMDICWRQLTDDEMCSSPLIDHRTTYTECCCLHGIAWGKLCAFCPKRQSG